MRTIVCLAAALVACALTPSPGFGEGSDVTNGSDRYISGSAVMPALDGSGETFAAGATVVLRGRAGGDTHAAGFDVSVEAPVTGDLYAAGGSVTVYAPVSEDLTAAGFSLRTTSEAVVSGNARLAGGVLVLDGPVAGALTASGGEVTLNAAISGDVRLAARTVSFGPEARIDGRLMLSAPAPVDVPETVIAADRVRYEPLRIPDAFAEAARHWEDGPMPEVPVFGAALLTLALTLVFLIALSAILLAFAGATVERLRKAVEARPGVAALAGLGGLSALFGMVPVAALTLLGIPFVPFALVLVVVGWTLGYLLGLHVVTMRLLASFGKGGTPGLAAQLAVLSLGLVVAALLNFVPFLGWFVNVVLVVLGVGGMTLAIFERSRGTATPAAG
ncbi:MULTISPECIES: hypothetical protein [Salipiger]|jgi:hypothetical protein|uniref:DUF8173 domain-containing protein n=1 Tax=Salipiger profundus TaxID=1229727 RepID=A0A1U7D6B5_9RHOB|nr:MULTISPECIES: hypothetical protein [Salipiger]APX23648.1 hypothetical protein Ga0080559_TMP2852 [Salipiger profundus]GGA16946.1 hypothetical protein GCM10011326_31820 [Salipiger profundus]SFD32829.1 hypothetical protein SAMN05444415_109221 [Salipiger profundus]